MATFNKTPVYIVRNINVPFPASGHPSRFSTSFHSHLRPKHGNSYAGISPLSRPPFLRPVCAFAKMSPIRLWPSAFSMPGKIAVMPHKLRPVAIKPPVLMERTQPLIKKLTAALGEPIFTYWNSTKGSICQNDVIGLYALLRHSGKLSRLSLFLKSDGGSGRLLCAWSTSCAATPTISPFSPLSVPVRRHHAGPRRRHRK